MIEPDAIVTIEIFAAKDQSGVGTDLFMAVSRKCGLSEADSLLLDGYHVLAMQKKSILPIDFPLLDQKRRDKLLDWSQTGKQLPVAEFSPAGLYDAYFLDLVIAA